LTASSLARAHAFMKSHARLGALMIAPLAAAVPAHAGSVVLPTSGFGCTYTDSTTPVLGSNCPIGAGGVTQLGAGGVSFSLSSGGGVLQGSSPTLIEQTTGQVATAIPAGTSVSYSYDFLLSYEAADPNWSLVMELADEGQSPGPAIAIGGPSTITGTFGESVQEFSGSGTFQTAIPTNANDYIEVYYILRLSGLPGNAFTTVQVPAGTSIDFDTISLPSPSTGTPEPASFGLLGAGLAWLGWKYRRRSATGRD
jgi:hypothetical protein